MNDIATKLITVANHTPAVADAVNAAKAAASGAVVRVDDVLEVEHGVGVQLRSETVTDFSGKAVKVYGKNLFDDVAFYEASDFVRQEDGSWYGPQKNTTIFENTAAVPGSFALTVCAKRQAADKNSIVFGVYYTDGTMKYASMSGIDDFERKIFITDATKTVASIVWSYNVPGYAYVKYAQIEYGAVATDYEPYKEPQTATADASGKVNGLRSVAPTMTLMADSDAVTVECTCFPTSAADTYAKYEALQAEQTALQEYLHRRK